MKIKRMVFIPMFVLMGSVLIISCQKKETQPGGAAGPAVKVVIWDEEQPEQKGAYPNFIAYQIADYLNTRPGMSVQTARLDDPEQGLSAELLDNCQVLIWWGHLRHAEVPIEKGEEIVRRIKNGQLSLITLHAAHWSTPFVEAMNERTRMDAQKMFPPSADEQVEFEYIPPAERFTPPQKGSILTPYFNPRKFPDGLTRVFVHLPNSCFPDFRPDAGPSYVKTVEPEHPIADGIPATFTIPNTEMYDEPFHVPEPDEVVFEERWENGEWFRSGAVWNLGKGKVFYFRPGHETYRVYFEEMPLKIIENAARWLAS